MVMESLVLAASMAEGLATTLSKPSKGVVGSCGRVTTEKRVSH